MLRPSGWYIELNPVKACLFNLSPIKLEWPASFSGPFLSSAEEGLFQRTLGMPWGACKPTSGWLLPGAVSLDHHWFKMCLDWATSLEGLCIWGGPWVQSSQSVECLISLGHQWVQSGQCAWTGQGFGHGIFPAACHRPNKGQAGSCQSQECRPGMWWAGRLDSVGPELSFQLGHLICKRGHLQLLEIRNLCLLPHSCPGFSTHRKMPPGSLRKKLPLPDTSPSQRAPSLSPCKTNKYSCYLLLSSVSRLHNRGG